MEARGVGCKDRDHSSLIRERDGVGARHGHGSRHPGLFRAPRARPARSTSATGATETRRRTHPGGTTSIIRSGRFGEGGAQRDERFDVYRGAITIAPRLVRRT